MDLILWRHAEAEELGETEKNAQNDLARRLTSRGEKQALRMAAWLDRQLPDSARVLVSPARRCEQTALALGAKYKLRPELAPDATPAQLLELVQWPLSKSPVVVVGHQPMLGQVIAQLLGLKEGECTLKKGALWWLRTRERDGQCQTVVLTVQSPEFL
ncbi:MAG: SixA phosphatase family protein [Polaromonas sp.]